MFFVGIDIGKNNHVASMMDETGKVLFKAFSFPNTSDGGEPCFPNLLLILPAPPTLKSVWKLPATIGFLFTLFFLKRRSLSMSSIQFKPMAGVKGPKSANAKTISSVPYSLLT